MTTITRTFFITRDFILITTFSYLTVYTKELMKGKRIMFDLKISLFAKTKSLEKKIDQFHDKILDVSMIFLKAVKVFLEQKRSEEYKKLNKQIKQIEHDADVLRREIEDDLYRRNLIPDLRGDVLQIVENLDKVVNNFDETVYRFYVEQPEIPTQYHSRLIELCRQVSECAENMVIASRCFFKDSVAVRDYAQKVYFIENETDILSGKLRENIFESDMELAQKLQISSIVSKVADIADIAEDCIDELLIVVVKRDI